MDLPPRPLLVVCALGIERTALRGARRAGPPAPVTLLRTGMGPDAAARAVGAALRDGGLPADCAVAVAGFCAGLLPGTAPGDVVVDDRSDGASALAAAVRRRTAAAHGAARRAAVHTGRIHSADHLVRGAERAELAAAGAIAADMETDAVRRAALAAGARPVAALRVVVDTPAYELVRPATVRTGITAFRVLRALLPALLDWHHDDALSWR